MPRKRKAPSSPSTRRRPSRLEYRAPADGAWYSVRVARQGGALRVMYEEFPEEMDEWYDHARLACARDVADFRARFRALSAPLDDSCCRDPRPGTPLCVSCALSGGEVMFYDAIFVSVSSSAHETVDGEERCKCRFLVQWTEGPLAGSMTEAGIEQICRIQLSPVEDPVLSEFLDRASNKLLANNGNRTAREMGSAKSDSEGGSAASRQGGSCSSGSLYMPRNDVLREQKEDIQNPRHPNEIESIDVGHRHA